MQYRPTKSYTNNELLDLVRPVYGWLDDKEALYLNQIAEIAASEIADGEKMIEIGSYMGKSSIAIGLACKKMNKGVLITVDPHTDTETQVRDGVKNSLPYLQKNIKAANLTKYIDIRKSTSKKLASTITTSSVKFIFLDGDHSVKGVFEDFKLWNRLIATDGFLLLHDSINLYGPRKLLLSLLLNNEFEYWNNVGDTACFRKKSHISIRNKIKKLYFFFVLKLFFVIYIPKVS